MSLFHELFGYYLFKETCFKRYSNPINNSFYLDSCYFSNFVSNEDFGGVVFFFSNILNSLINNCVFFHCSAQINGGAIYINSNFSCNTIVSNCCGSYCDVRSPNHGQFAYLYSSNNNKNEINDLSILKCSFNYEINRMDSIFFRNGIQKGKNTNFTNNLNNIRPGMLFYDSNTCNCSFFIFINNQPLLYRISSLYGGSNLR